MKGATCDALKRHELRGRGDVRLALGLLSWACREPQERRVSAPASEVSKKRRRSITALKMMSKCAKL
jgi:hypothetical protein